MLTQQIDAEKDDQKDEGHHNKLDKAVTVQELNPTDNSEAQTPVQTTTGVPGYTPNALDVLRSYNSCGSLDGAPSSPVVSPSSQKVSHFPEEHGEGGAGLLACRMDQGACDISAVNAPQGKDQCAPEKGCEFREGTLIPVIHQMGGICTSIPQSQAITAVNGSPEPGVPGVDDLSETDPIEADLGAETRAIMEKLVTFIQVGFQLEATFGADDQSLVREICALAGIGKYGVGIYGSAHGPSKGDSQIVAMGT